VNGTIKRRRTFCYCTTIARLRTVRDLGERPRHQRFVAFRALEAGLVEQQALNFNLLNLVHLFMANRTVSVVACTTLTTGIFSILATSRTRRTPPFPSLAANVAFSGGGGLDTCAGLVLTTDSVVVGNRRRRSHQQIGSSATRPTGRGADRHRRRRASRTAADIVVNIDVVVVNDVSGRFLSSSSSRLF